MAAAATANWYTIWVTSVVAANPENESTFNGTTILSPDCKVFLVEKPDLKKLPVFMFIEGTIEPSALII